MDSVDRELMAAAVDSLPAEERDVVNAIYFERATYRVLAARLGVSTTKVIDLRDNALQSLRTLIEDAMRAEDDDE